ncbi:unnamed protein product [Penicillium roqueforti FM164]|uniref:Genomic scaffold, ProqFM164S04 n=1 Tax=Penicillium roqueforti (strain FM164) TaxID=1365484 RepID=W6QJ17_PENRF|nr:unnamed protein product [Penicillium roqueforti FM164]
MSRQIWPGEGKMEYLRRPITPWFVTFRKETSNFQVPAIICVKLEPLVRR